MWYFLGAVIVYLSLSNRLEQYLALANWPDNGAGEKVVESMRDVDGKRASRPLRIVVPGGTYNPGLK